MKLLQSTFQELIKAGALEIGDGYRAKNDELGGNGPIFLRSAYLQDHGFVLHNPERFKSTQQSDFGSKIAKIGDVVITTKGNSTGRVGRIRGPQAGSVYSPHLSFWRSKQPDEIEQAFLFYWSQGHEFRTQLAGMSASTDMAPYLSLRDQLRVRISLPPIEHQRAIGSILGALDDKIDLNRRMNETLEAMARAIFKDWFVDFGPTRAKMEGRTSYLAPDLWALFPDHLDKGGKPEGWRRTNIGSVGRVVTGKTPSTTETNNFNGEYPFITIPDLDGRVYIEEAGRTLSELGAAAINGSLLPAGSVMMSCIATVGRCGITTKPSFTNQQINGVICNPTIEPEYLYWVFRHLGREVESAGGGGSVYTNVSKSRFSAIEILVPPQPIQNAFVGPWFKKGRANLQECHTLATTRDLLLPKLMSGEIRVREAEKVLEAVL